MTWAGADWCCHGRWKILDWRQEMRGRRVGPGVRREPEAPVKEESAEAASAGPATQQGPPGVGREPEVPGVSRPSNPARPTKIGEGARGPWGQQGQQPSQAHQEWGGSQRSLV